MRRPITAAEKQLLDKYCNEMMASAVITKRPFSPLALAISMTAGSIVGLFLCMILLAMENPLSIFMFLFCPIIISAVVEAIVINSGTKKILNGFFEVGKTEINGGTVVIDGEYEYPEYTEDDLLDEQEHPYRIMLPHTRLHLQNGERVIVIINGKQTLLMKAMKGLEPLIPSAPPQELAYDALHIGHRNQLEYPDLSVPDADEHIRRFGRNYKNNNARPKALAVLGAAFFGFCGAIVVIFSTYGLVFRETSMGDTFFTCGMLAIPILTIATVVIYSRIYGWQIKKSRGKILNVSKVILVSTRLSYAPNGSRAFMVCEQTKYGSIIADSYMTTGYDVRDVTKMFSGQTIYKYQFENGTCFFGTK